MTAHTSSTESTTVFVIKKVLMALYAAIIVAVVLAITVGGYSIGHDLSGSMDPTIKTGEWLIQHNASAEDMTVGKIVTYTNHPEMGHEFITHRIVATDGHTAITKGDANPVVDPQPITDADLVAVVVWHFSLPFGS